MPVNIRTFPFHDGKMTNTFSQLTSNVHLSRDFIIFRRNFQGIYLFIKYIMECEIAEYKKKCKMRNIML